MVQGSVWASPQVASAELGDRAAPLCLDFFRLCHFLNTVLR